MYEAELQRIGAASKGRIGPEVRQEELALESVNLAGDVEKHGTWTAIVGTPAELARLTGLDVETDAWARYVSAEQGTGPAQLLLAVAEVVRNEAARRKSSVMRVLTGENLSAAPWRAKCEGRYGEQHGRWASTRAAPNGRALDAVRVARAGSNLVKGASKFFDPRTNDAGFQNGRKLKPADEIVEKWTKEGNEPVILGAPLNPYHFMGFRFVGVGKVSPDAKAWALAQIDIGRSGQIGAPSVEDWPPPRFDELPPKRRS